jgi:hypothetical protein
MAKKIAKISPKPAAKPAAKPASRPAPKPAPLDLVRNPNFDSAMAQMNYENLMAGQRAQLAAQQGQYTKGRLMGAPTNQPTQSRVPMGFSTYDEAGIPEDQRKILDDEMAKMQLDIAARDVEQQNMKKAGAFTIGGTPDKPIYGSMAGPVYADGTFVDATNQQAQNYQNFLQQGMQRSNTMNQAPAAGFANAAAGLANLQPGMQPTQPAMPVAGMGMGMQQPKQTQPRKFSTVRNSPARFA